MQALILIGLASMFNIVSSVNILGPDNIPAFSSCDSRTEEFDGIVKTYCCVNCVKIFEFDEILPGSCCIDNGDNGDNDDNRRRLNPTPVNRGSYWINGYIPYEIESTLPNVPRIYLAIAEWHSKTNIRLGPRNGESDYVRFVEHESSCSSYIGKIGGEQIINVPDWCGAGGIVHEIGHALGMDHTQSRHDRDLYIDIDFDNIPTEWRPNYNQVDQSYDDCLRYDYGSIMHYDALFDGKTVITTINPPNSAIGQSDGLSTIDAVCMNSHYSRCRVALFQHGDFTGKEYSPFGSNTGGVMDNIYNLNELALLEFDNDQVSSMKIYAEANTKCIAELYQDADFNGWKATVIADNSDRNEQFIFTYTLSDLSSYGFINDDMSSMKIVAESTCSITLFQDINFSGNKYGPYIIGDYTLGHLEGTGIVNFIVNPGSFNTDFVNDDVSSMRVNVMGGHKCIIKLYQHDRYDGWEATITAINSNTESKTFSYSISDLESYGFINDDMSSMKITSNPVESASMSKLIPFYNIKTTIIIIIGLLVINICCMAYYFCFNKNKSSKYETVSFQSDTDEEQKIIIS